MKLTEIKSSDSFLTKESEILAWLKKYADCDIAKVEIDENGAVTIDGDVTIYDSNNISELKVNFAQVRDFSAEGVGLVSFKGFPQKCIGWVDAKDNPHIKSLEGITKESTTEVGIGGTGIISLKDVHKHIIRTKRLLLPRGIKSNILGICHIKDLNFVGVQYVDSVDPDKRLTAALKIMNKYLRQGNAGVVKAQRELIDNDLDEFAEL